MEEIFNKLKRLREEKKLNQVAISKEIGISNTAYSNIEKGITKSISLDIAVKISKILNVDFIQLFDIESNSNLDRENQMLKEQIQSLKQEIVLLKSQLSDKIILEDYFKRDILEFKSLLVSWPLEYFGTEKDFIKNSFDKQEISENEFERRMIELPEKTAQGIAMLIKNKLFLLTDFDRQFRDEQLKSIILRVHQILNK